MTRHRVATAVLAAALSVAGCTSDDPDVPDPSTEPSPTTTSDGEAAPPDDQLDVALVLPAPEEVDRELSTFEDAVDRVRASFGNDLTALREVHLDGAGFRVDVMTVLGEEGTALTCAVGAGARDVVQVAQSLPGRRFCSVDDRIEEVPGNVVATWFRYEEAAYVLGFASAQMLPEGPGGTLGFVTNAFGTRSERERLAFTAGARAARPEVAVAVETLTVDDGGTVEARAAEVAAQLYDERGAGVIFVTTGVPAEPFLQAAQERLRLVAGIGPPLSRGAPSGLEPFVLATAHARLELGFSVPLTRFLEGWQGGVVSLGFAEEALVLTPGGSVRWNEVRDAVADLRGRIERGEVAVA